MQSIAKEHDMGQKVDDLAGPSLNEATAKALNLDYWKNERGNDFVFDNPCGWPGACPGWHKAEDIFTLMGLATEDLKRARIKKVFGDEIDL